MRTRQTSSGISFRVGLAVGVMGLAALAQPSWLAAQQAQGVSPGSSVAAVQLSSSCPTFSWSAVEGSRGYELVVYEVAASGDLAPVVRSKVPGGASSWTPSAAECPRSNARYAWAVRSHGKQGIGPWSEALMFATAGMPSEDEVRQALGVLNRYREGQDKEDRNDRMVDFQADRVSLEQDSMHPAASGSGKALTAPTLGGATSSPQVVTTPASFALNVAGDFDLGGGIFKGGTSFLYASAVGPNNAGVGQEALINATPGVPGAINGSNNAAFGPLAMKSNTSGFRNTAVGSAALYANGSGAYNTATGFWALLSNISGSKNTAMGASALRNNTGGQNTATGFQALYGVSGMGTTYGNTASGYQALKVNRGNNNTAMGSFALWSNTTGTVNVAIGKSALVGNNVGYRNTALGYDAMTLNTSGKNNTAVGVKAGKNWSTGASNIAIGQGAYGVAAESGAIRIGGINLQSKTFIEGIGAATGTFATGVCIDAATDQLGPCTPSSKRFKEHVRPMGNVQQKLEALRPVRYRYKAEFAGAEEQPIQYGLIAEEVARVFPTLVSYDEQGNPHTVRYSLLTPMLLNQLQRQDEELEELRRTVARMQRKKRFRSD